MTCPWCHASIDFAAAGRPCPKSVLGHFIDNRHHPVGGPCRCGRSAEEHRVGHRPQGNPCTACGLPGGSHITKRSLRSKRVLTTLRKRDGWTCRLCEHGFSSRGHGHPHPRSVEVDHIDPTGGDALENLQLAHRLCNMLRGNGPLPDDATRATWRTRLNAATASFRRRRRPLTTKQLLARGYLLAEDNDDLGEFEPMIGSDYGYFE